jgi:hypothetical protein
MHGRVAGDASDRTRLTGPHSEMIAADTGRGRISAFHVRKGIS